jgi:hypothetical protein
MMIVNDEVSDHRSCDKTRKGEDVGQVVDLLVARFVEFESRL